MACLMASTRTQAQQLNKKLCAEFRAAPDLYVIDIAINTKQLRTDSGEEISFVDLVRANWPDKNVVVMDRKEYDRMKGVAKVFYISLLNFRVLKDGLEHSSMDGIAVKRGKWEGVSSNSLYWQSLNTDQIMQGVVPERMVIAVKSIAHMLKDPDDGSEREKYSYKAAGHKRVLKAKTLYIKESQVKDGLKKDLKKLYPYKLELVSNEQWAQALASKQEDVLVLELITGNRVAAVDIHDPVEERIIVSAYPFTGHISEVPKSFFKVFD
jgi:hypothetical protein